MHGLPCYIAAKMFAHMLWSLQLLVFTKVHWIHVRVNLFKFPSNVIEVNVRSETISTMQRCFCGEINTYIVCGEFAVQIQIHRCYSQIQQKLNLRNLNCDFCLGRAITTSGMFEPVLCHVYIACKSSYFQTFSHL